jgi:hypothetical protein
MWEVIVHDDGDVQISKVPSAYHNNGTVLLFHDRDSLVAELISYGKSDEDIEEALQDVEGNEYAWRTV